MAFGRLERCVVVPRGVNFESDVPSRSPYSSNGAAAYMGRRLRLDLAALAAIRILAARIVRPSSAPRRTPARLRPRRLSKDIRPIAAVHTQATHSWRDHPPTDGHADTTRRLFVAMPFNKDMDDVYEYGIRRTAVASGWICERADREVFTGDVVEWVEQRIQNADLVLAEMTGANPNVYFEVGLARGKRRPVLLVARDASELRFDLRSEKCAVYTSIRDLEEQVRRYLAKL